MATDSEQADSGVAKGGQVLRSVAELYLALIFAERHVAQPVQAFNAPMGSPAGGQQGRVGTLAREAADGVLHLGRRFALADRRAFQAADLSEARPVQMLGQTCAGLKMPLDPSSMPFARRASFRERLLPLPLRSGGKIRAEIPPQWRPSARADYL